MPNKPIYLDDLIKKASEAAGNDNRLAKRLQVGRSSIADWKSGRSTCPPADQALLAAVAGLDPDAWGCRALIAQHEGTAKGELLKQALKKALVATGGAVGICGSTAAEAASNFIRCIKSKAKRYRIGRFSSLFLLMDTGTSHSHHGGAHPHTPESRLTLVATGIQ